MLETFEKPATRLGQHDCALQTLITEYFVPKRSRCAPTKQQRRRRPKQINHSTNSMAEPGVPHNVKAREDWRRLNSHIHQEEQKLKELQLDHSEKVAAVEALKAELRHARNEAQDCEQKEAKLVQATLAAYKRLQELHQQWNALQTDRSMLMQQLSAEQDGLKDDKAKVEAAKIRFKEELEQQRTHMQHLQSLIAQQQPDDDTAPAVDVGAEDRGQEGLPLQAVVVESCAAVVADA